jgi:hypothetical protein
MGNENTTIISRAAGYIQSIGRNNISFAGGIDRQGYVWTAAHSILHIGRQLGYKSIDQQLQFLRQNNVIPLGPLFISASGLVDGPVKAKRSNILEGRVNERIPQDKPFVDSPVYNASTENVLNSFFIPTFIGNPNKGKVIQAKAARLNGNLYGGDSGTVLYDNGNKSRAVAILGYNDDKGVYFFRLDPDYYKRSSSSPLKKAPHIRILKGKADYSTLPEGIKFVDDNKVKRYLLSNNEESTEKTLYA